VENICKHIEKLLAQHDYVVVPNFGGFVVQNQSAVIMPNCIVAPKDTIGFNPLMHHSDGLLAIEIAKTESISYRMAMEMIDRAVENINLKLQAAGSIQFGNLGIFQQNATGNTHFQPNGSVDFLPQNFGLANVRVSTRMVRHDEERRKVSFTLPSSNVYKYAAAAMLVFGLLLISPEVNDVRRSNNADFSSFAFIKDSNARIEKNAVAAVVKDTVVKDTVVKVVSEVAEMAKFHVIVASLPTKESADIYCKELAIKEFVRASVVSSSRNYRVAVQSFATRESAVTFMENLRKTDSRFETAWVLCN
jgi:nucleoid DNA-binding protein